MAGRTRIGELELCVLERLWEAGQSDAKAMHRSVCESRSISHNTVQSTLERLYRKGLLSREKVSHAYVYTPLVSREGLASRMVREVVDTLSQDRDGLVSAFVDIAVRADEKMLEELKHMISRYREELAEK